MKIIAHRGFWETEEEKNTLTALKRAIECGFGFETDFRDCNGKVIVSHNPPRGDEITADEVFMMYREVNSDKPLAIDIKADGLQDMLLELFNKYDIYNYFLVDMSVCDTIPYINKRLRIASRSSEFEPTLPFYKDSVVVWIDYFDGRASIIEEMEKYIRDGKIPCVVSPELHGLPYENMWKALKSLRGEFYLCTDYPDKAKQFFNT